MTDPNITAFTCTSIGIAGTTKVFVKKTEDGGFEARVGIAIFGSTNRKDDGLKDANPFDKDFNDNYASGKGPTEQEALDALKADMEKTADGLWDEPPKLVLGMFDHAFVINLDRRKDRMDLLLPELARVGIEAERFPAIEPKEGKYGLSTGKLGCKLSHLEVVKLAQARKYRNVLILEDDVIFHKNFNDLWTWYRERLDLFNWDLFTFGAHLAKDPTLRISDRLWRLNQFSLGHCYAVNESLYEKYIWKMGGADHRNHDYVLRDLHRGRIVLCPNPYLAWQRSGYSDLVGKEVDWTHEYDKLEGLKGFAGMPNNLPVPDLSLYFICRFCTNMAEQWDKGVKVCQLKCGGPKKGMSYPLYKGPMTAPFIQAHCFVCGEHAEMRMEVKATPDSPKVLFDLGICLRHLPIFDPSQSKPAHPAQIGIVQETKIVPVDFYKMAGIDPKDLGFKDEEKK